MVKLTFNVFSRAMSKHTNEVVHRLRSKQKRNNKSTALHNKTQRHSNIMSSCENQCFKRIASKSHCVFGNYKPSLKLSAKKWLFSNTQSPASQTRHSLTQCYCVILCAFWAIHMTPFSNKFGKVFFSFAIHLHKNSILGAWKS